MRLRIGRSCKRVFSKGAQRSMTFCALLAVAGLFAGTASAANWKEITPDAAFHHWTRFSIPPDTPPGSASQWTKRPDGTIYCTGRGGHEFYRYDHELGNFDLHVEWLFPKLDPPPKYNSGVSCATTRMERSGIRRKSDLRAAADTFSTDGWRVA